jgi:hypothetical protein
MAETVERRRTGDPTGYYPSSPWAMGASVFAGSTMVVVGVLQFFEGLVALVNGNDFLLSTANYLFRFDASVWGWTHLVIGLLVAAAGVLVFTGSRVARGVGILLAGLSAIANFLWMPYYPVWALTLLALSVFVIWGLASSNLGDD